MVHLSRLNPTAFAGELADWARRFANWSALALIEARSPKVGFITSFPADGKFCLIVPEVAADCVRVTALYGLRRNFRAATLAHWKIDADRWRSVCRAWVKFEITPSGIVGVDHDATVRSAAAIAQLQVMRSPEPAAVDAALGSQPIAHKFRPFLIEGGHCR
jgi:hypothetical protein